MGIAVFVGSRDNVLERFWQASEKFGGDLIMRATGDNPFTDPGYAALTIETMIASGADLCYFPDLPLGTGVGMVKKSALDAAYRLSDRPHQLEHVTPYIREHPEQFNILVRDIGITIPFPKLRLTVDTPEDYELAKAIYRHCYHGAPFTLDDVVQFLEKNPALLLDQQRHRAAADDAFKHHNERTNRIDTDRMGRHAGHRAMCRAWPAWRTTSAGIKEYRCRYRGRRISGIPARRGAVTFSCLDIIPGSSCIIRDCRDSDRGRDAAPQGTGPGHRDR